MRLSTGQGKPKVVLDTNIVVSALIAEEGAPAIVFGMLILGEIENYANSEIIKELTAVLEREEITKRTTKTARDFILENYLQCSIQIPPCAKITAVEHAADNKFIEAALDAKADYLITGDWHLLKLGHFMGIQILRAKGFLEKLPSSSR